MNKSVIFQTGMKLLTPLLLLGSFLIFWRGHHLPGGGFIGGLVAGATLATHSYCYGIEQTLRLVKIAPLSFVVVGIFIALMSGILSLAIGMQPFSGLWVNLPLIGSIGTPVLFDFGVYLLVVGFVLVFVSQVAGEKT